MSKTDKTKPWYVWLYEHPKYAEEVHRCQSHLWFGGPCDLPEFTPEGIHNVAGAKCQWLPKDRWGTTQAHGRVCNCKWCFPAAHKSRSRDKRQWRKDWGLTSDCSSNSIGRTGVRNLVGSSSDCPSDSGERAQAGWESSGEGWNAYSRSDEFRQVNPDIQNPYLPDED